MIPRECPGVPRDILRPENTWKDRHAFQEQAARLAGLFKDNYSQLEFKTVKIG
jgi:phosphoenolpyruvate carboxykinase (ATP)